MMTYNNVFPTNYFGPHPTTMTRTSTPTVDGYNNKMVTSFYIPHVPGEILKEKLKEILENKFDIGIITKIECIPKIGNGDRDDNYSCFVFFESLSYSNCSFDIQLKFKKGLQPRLYYDEKKYLVICQNTSEVAYYKDPKHMDLIFYVNKSFKGDSIEYLCILEQLDLGEIQTIDMKNEVDSCHSVKLCFKFWYRTKNAYRFQQELMETGSVKVRIAEDEQWTFYYEKPLLDGVNPNVWYKSKFCMR
jgi:hypothetical protein